MNGLIRPKIELVRAYMPSWLSASLMVIRSKINDSMMLHIQFDQDRPTGFRDIQVRLCKIFVSQGQVTAK